MKKILFAVPQMMVGGVEKALLSLIGVMPKKDIEITFLLVQLRGRLVPDIPPYVKIKEIITDDVVASRLLGGGTGNAVKYYLGEKKFFTAAKIVIKKIFGDAFPEFNAKFDDLKPIDEKYDIAVCYHMHMPFILRYVAEKVFADKKFAWIHNDFVSSRYNIKRSKKYLNGYDRFFAVSEQLRNEFLDIFPEYSDKTDIFYNIVDTEKVLKLADEDCDFGDVFDGLRILSVGRLNVQKGFDIAAKVAEKLKHDGQRFKWYILGEGEEKANLEKLIAKKQISDCFVLLGAKSNPYPYFKNCDIYVQPSRHEGYCTTVNEARVLAKPIVATDVAGTREMLVHNKSGLIAQADTESIYTTLKSLLDSREQRTEISDNLKQIDFTNRKQLEELFI